VKLFELTKSGKEYVAIVEEMNGYRYEVLFDVRGHAIAFHNIAIGENNDPLLLNILDKINIFKLIVQHPMFRLKHATIQYRII